MKPHQPVHVAPAIANETRRVPTVDDDSRRNVFHRRLVVPLNHDDHLLLDAAAPDPEIVFAIGQVEMDRARRIGIDAGRVVAVKALDVFDLHQAAGRKAAHGHAVGVRVRTRVRLGDGILQSRVERAAGNRHLRRDVPGGQRAARELQRGGRVLKAERPGARSLQGQAVEADRNARSRDVHRHASLRVGA